MTIDEQIKFYIDNGKTFMLHGASGIGKSRRIKELDPEPYLDKNGKVKGYYFTPISIIDNLKMAYAEWVADKHEQVNMGLKDNWQSAAWLLERRVRSEYAKEEVTETKDKVESIKVTFVDPKDSQDRLAKLEQEVKDNVGGN